MSWRAIPLALRIAAILIIAMAVIGLGQQAFDNFHWVIRLSMIRAAMSVAVKGLAIFGALELAGLVPGIAATGARVAAAGWALTLALSVFDEVLSLSVSFARTAEMFVRWGWFVAVLAVGVGLVIAAWRKPALAILGGVLWILADHPPPLEEWFYKQFTDHPMRMFYIDITLYLFQGIGMLLLAATAVGTVPKDFVIREPDRVRRGFSGLASSMWIRVMSISMLPLLAFFMMGSTGRDSAHIMTYTIVGASLVNVLSLFVFGWGALEAARAQDLDVRRAPLLVAAVGALWCAGIALRQVPDVYAFMTGGESFGNEGQWMAEAFSIIAPLVAAGAVIAAAIAISGFAQRRQHLELASRATNVGILFALLQGANLVVMNWMLPEARSNGSALMILLLALGCSLSGIVMFARLARDAASLVTDHSPKLPTATML